MELLTDDELMRKVRDGEVERLGLLFERYSGPLFNYLLRLTGRRDVSEDLVQEVFFRVLKHRHTYRDDGGFTTWIYRIARNAHIDSLRKGRAETPLAPDAQMETLLSDPAPGVDLQIEYRQDEAILLQALDRLPAEKREILVLSRFERMKSNEIAKVLSCTAGSARARVHRALEALRNTFTEIAQEKAR